jgi:glutaminyl-tRNA synthetase
MPTLAGLRRRGVTPGAIREFCRRIGVTKQDNLIEMGLLEFCVRQDLEGTAPRGMGVLDPIKVTLTNYVGDGETLRAPWHPQRPELGERELPFGAQLYIERDDFAEAPPPKYKRLAPGELVRLRYGYIIRCDAVIKDANGTVTGLECTYFADSRSGEDTSGLKPKGVIHWVAAAAAVPVSVRLYDLLFKVPQPGAETLAAEFNRDSLEVVAGFVEPAIMASPVERFQFERLGYFCKDSVLPATFNRTVSLRDSWKPPGDQGG